MLQSLIKFLDDSKTAYHAVKNAAELLTENGFIRLSETEDWEIHEGGKYFVVRNGSSLIAFTVGSPDTFSYKIVASHVDSVALKLKEQPLKRVAGCTTLNVETYGGGLWYSFLDRPLALAGRVVKRVGSTVKEETVTAPFTLSIPSLAIHQNRTANEGFPVNPQVDLLPLLSLAGDDVTNESFVEKLAGENVLAYDLYLVNASAPYLFGLNEEFLASPRIDNSTSVYASLQALLSHEDSEGICIAALLDNEEVGSLTVQGADGDFLEKTLRRIAYALRFDDNEYYKALASSFLLSVDNAHAKHPNHPEKSDPTNDTLLGKGLVIKNHAAKAYITDATSSAVLKTVFENASVKYQSFFNRSDVRSGSTLGVSALRHTGMLGADVGIAQLAMHSACECCAIEDYKQLENGLRAFFSVSLVRTDDGVIVR